MAFNDANRTPNAVLSQTFTTVPGGTYTLAFGMGTISFNTLPQRLQVTATGDGTLLTQDLTMNGQGNGIVQWTSRNFMFTANTGSTTLVFRDLSTGTNNIDLLLDNVRVIVESIPNRPPLATADSHDTPEDTPLTVTAPGVLGNDTDPDSDGLTAIVDESPLHGILALEADGGFTYTPESGYSGTDSFTYHASDGELDSEVVTVSLGIIPEPEPPPPITFPTLTLDEGSATVSMDDAPAGTWVLETSQDLGLWEEMEVKLLEEAGLLEFEPMLIDGSPSLFFRVGRRE